MKLSSFRLRIALFAALLASVAVSGFGGISYVLLYQSKTENLDQDIQARLIRDAAIPRSEEVWQSLEESRNLLLTNSVASEALLLVYDSNQQLIYQSDRWEAELNTQLTFPPVKPLPTELTNPRRPPPSNRDNPRRPPNLDRLRDLVTIGNLTTRNTPTGKWRIGTVSSPFVQMAIAINLEVVDQEMALIRNIFVLLIPSTLVMVMVGASWLSSNALGSVQKITNTLKKVTAKGLDQRASTTGLDTEFLELVKVFNQMMARLERSFQQASRFSGDAAHELKTPLAILQGELEQAMQNAPAGSPQQQTFGRLLDEIRRLSSITRKLLLLSLADAGQMKLQSQTINFSELVLELAEDIELMAPELNLKLKITPNLQLKGDRQLITQVLQNLITNAIKYNISQGIIAIETFQNKQTILLKISNTSNGLKDGDRQRVFDRFQRGDASHNRKVEGFGLGLSLSREIARAHGGDLKLEPVSQLVTFTLTLPTLSMR